MVLENATEILKKDEAKTQTQFKKKSMDFIKSYPEIQRELLVSEVAQMSQPFCFIASPLLSQITSFPSPLSSPKNLYNLYR